VKTGKVDAKMLKEAAYASVPRLEERAQRRPAREARPQSTTRRRTEQAPEPKPIPEREQKMLARSTSTSTTSRTPRRRARRMKFLKANI
jgi:hypothetical protein